MNSKINWPVFTVLVVYPVLILLGIALYIAFYGVCTKELWLAVIAYYVSNISVGVGLHRLWSHGAYKVNRVVEIILIFTSAFSLQGPVLAWVSDHKFHHAYPDTDKDPHTPVKYQNPLKGFFWAHLGWMIFGESTTKHIDKGTISTLGKDKMLVWQLKNYWQLALFTQVVPTALLGFAFFNAPIQAMLAGFLFCGLGRALQQQMTFSVNSICHFWGKRRYADDSSVDVWWLALLLLGENWHNYHHAFGKDYRNGHKWYHLDVHKWIIWCMSKIGLARDLHVTPEVRVAAVQREYEQKMLERGKQQTTEAKDFAWCTLNAVSQKLVSLEKMYEDALQSTSASLGTGKLQSTFSNLVLSMKNRISQDFNYRAHTVSQEQPSISSALDCVAKINMIGELLQKSIGAVKGCDVKVIHQSVMDALKAGKRAMNILDSVFFRSLDVLRRAETALESMRKSDFTEIMDGTKKLQKCLLKLKKKCAVA
ncbi:putative acyl-CoA desaturase [Candidatus Fokinia solitaria]|uniref:Putative acyl-CoA desaturase n=1 Tax=Candidatus Fokinia solitaria TaxID=1802984 RepID=A0A2U8BSZ0_9RICK|nr:fatty acid desaturase [Candidatus Fokinia solitaria]AWD33443.1 putative acyl-CoA desaturase [Candidatus Fokinia solitaria]